MEIRQKVSGKQFLASGFSLYKAMPTRTECFPLTLEINRVELAAPSGFQESGSPE